MPVSYSELVQMEGKPAGGETAGARAGQGGQAARAIDPDTAMKIRTEAAQQGVADYATQLMGMGLSAEAVREHIADAGGRREALANFGGDDGAAAVKAFDAKLAEGVTPAEAAGAAFDAAAEAAENNEVQARILPTAGGGQTMDNPQFAAQTYGEALYCQMNGETPSGAAAPYVGMNVGEMMADWARRTQGVSMGQAGAAGAVRAAMQTRPDLPAQVVADISQRLIRSTVAQPDPASIRQLSREISKQDYRPVHTASFGEYGPFHSVEEHGEFPNSPITGEGGVVLTPDTYGFRFGLTTKAIVDGELFANLDNVSKAAVAAMDFEAKKIAELIESNPKYFDGVPIFDGQHNNVASAGSDITVSALNEARTALRTQKDPSGNVYLNIRPSYIIVNPAREAEAQQAVAQIQPNEPSQVNPFSNALRVLVDPRLDEKAWYVAGAPSVNPAINHAYVGNQRGPQVDTRAGFEFDGIEVRVRLDFGVGWGDYRPIFKNPGK